jgi:predicted glycoside hydrolase/deacetylase ChbG (UPF0249 family)
VQGRRYLIVIADDYGIGPSTSQGILDLAAHDVLGGAVLLVNSPFAEAAVRAWRQEGMPFELGWHPNLTLDQPVAPINRVSSLVGKDGRFRPLGRFLARLVRGKVKKEEIAIELAAQHRRFVDLVGQPPPFCNAHHHVHIFPPVGRALLEILKGQRPLPYVRKVRESWRMLVDVPGARKKRALLSLLGRRFARGQDAVGLPGNDWLVGVTDPPWLADPNFFVRWLRKVPGRVVELTCHPGHLDPTLIGRDCTLDDGMLQRRMRELHLLRLPVFREAAHEAGFTLIAPSQLNSLFPRGTADAA